MIRLDFFCFIFLLSSTQGRFVASFLLYGKDSRMRSRMYHVNHFCPVFQVYQPSELNGASLIWEAWGRAHKWHEANVLSTPDLSRKPGKVWDWLLKSRENKQSYAERLFFQSRNFLANLFWHQIDPDTDSWHWNVGCNFHLETVGWLPARVSWVSWQLEGLLPLQRCTPSPLHPETILRYLRNKSSQVEWVQFRCLDYKGHLSTGRREYICNYFLHFFVYLIKCKDFLYLYKKYKLKAQSVSTFTPSVHEVMQYLRKWPGKNINFALLSEKLRHQGKFSVTDGRDRYHLWWE